MLNETQGFMEVYEVEGVIFGWLTTLDLFLIGSAGGAAVAGGLAHILGKGDYDALAESSAYLASLLGLASFLIVILKFGGVTATLIKVLYSFIRFSESVVFAETALRTAFVGVAAVNAILWLFRKETLINYVVRIFCEAVNIVLGLSVTVYPALVLASTSTKPFLGSPLFPMVICVSAILTGLVLSVFAIPIIGVFVPRLCPSLLEARRTVLIHKIPEKAGLPMSILIIIELILISAYLASVSGTLGYNLVFTDIVVSTFFWGGFVLLGLIVPLVVYVLERLRLGIPVSVWILILYLCFILIAVGNIAGRYALLAAGQLF
jgi:formate-dependent nitrite reductase membrane component NrfD